MIKKAIFVLLFSLGCILPGAQGFSADSGDYLVGEGDLLKIAVYEHPDLTVEARISGDGKITLPLIGEVSLGGLTLSGAEKVIRQRYADGFIISPQVSVFIREYKSKKVTVLGEFIKPGLVELTKNSTLLEVISSAGGITDKAGETLHIQRKVMKPGSGKDTDVTITVELKRLLEDGDVKMNIQVRDGDSIYVPKAAFVYVNGEVKSPGAYKITKGLTVLKAVTVAGGFTQKASKGRTKIIRKTVKEGKALFGETTIDANMEDIVLPDDIVYVPESIF